MVSPSGKPLTTGSSQCAQGEQTCDQRHLFLRPRAPSIHLFSDPPEPTLNLATRVGGHGGIIAVLPDGSFAIDFSTERMAWGLATVAEQGEGSMGHTEHLEGGGNLQVGIDLPPKE